MDTKPSPPGTEKRLFPFASPFNFDLVLLDIAMPHMDGFEIARRLRGSHQSKLIAHSGYFFKEHQLGGLFDAYVLKPVPFPELLDLITQTLKNAAPSGEAA